MPICAYNLELCKFYKSIRFHIYINPNNGFFIFTNFSK